METLEETTVATCYECNEEIVPIYADYTQWEWDTRWNDFIFTKEGDFLGYTAHNCSARNPLWEDIDRMLEILAEFYENYPIGDWDAFNYWDQKIYSGGNKAVLTEYRKDNVPMSRLRGIRSTMKKDVELVEGIMNEDE